MTFKSFNKKLDKAITQLSSSLDLEEAFYIADDAKALEALVVELQKALKNPPKVVKISDHPFKLQCQLQIDEALFFLKEAEEFLA